MIQYSGYYSKYDQKRLVQDSAYYYKMARVLFKVWFSIQRIIKNGPGYYSVSVSGFCVLLKNVQSIFQRMIQYSANYYKNVPDIIRSLVHDSAHYLNMSRVIFYVWFSIQRIILKWLG